MIGIAEKIARLRELMKLKQGQEEVEKPEPIVAVESQPETTSEESHYLQEEVEQHDDGLCLDKQRERPPSLRGLSAKEILLMEQDGLLTEQEREWLAAKNPLDPNGWPNFPNIAVLQRQAQKQKIQ
jgi:hypothetical protein